MKYIALSFFLFIALSILTYHFIRHRSRLSFHSHPNNKLNLLVLPNHTHSEDIKSIPRIIHQTFYNKSIIPQKIFDNMKMFAYGFQHIIYDDNDILEFLKQNFEFKVVDAFLHLKEGAHKADLFRYCILYIQGGVYLDIKTELIMDLNDLIQDDQITTVIDRTQQCIYQGIIAAPPRQPIFLYLIEGILNAGSAPPYNLFIKDFYRFILWDLQLKKLKEGKFKGKQHNYSLFTETCSKKNADLCYDGFDRYGLCCNIFFNKKRIIKTRYADYPWKKENTT